MTPTQEAAMRQALEALDKLYLPGELERVNAAITALKAALAEPVQKPVAWEQFHEHMAGPSYRAPPQRKENNDD